MRVLGVLAGFLMMGSTLFGQGFTVVSVSPAPFARSASTVSPVLITFSGAVDPSTVNSARVRVFGRFSGTVPGTLSVSGSVVTFSPARPYFAGELVFLVIASGVHAQGGAALIGGFSSSFHAKAGAGSNTFVSDPIFSFRQPGEGLIRTYGFYAGDIDRDGSPDMSAANEVSYDVRLYKNTGCGSFGPMTLTAMPSGEEPSPNEGADFNGDGWLDFVTGNQNGQSIAIFLNNGAGNYLPPVIYPAGGQVHGLAVFDAEGDGDLDVIAANFNTLALFRNNGNGTFAPATFFDGGGNGEWGVAVADSNGDGWTDIYCGNFLSNTIAVLRNNGAGVFTITSTTPCGGNPWAMEIADFDGDGRPDVSVANNGQSNLGVLRGTATGGLTSVVTYNVGASPVWIDLGDLEGDGDIDIVVASFSGVNATILRNNGSGVFTNAGTLPSSQAASSVVIVDFDRDGDLDIMVTDELADDGHFYRQSGPAPASVQPPTCASALRVNSFALRAGFGALPAQTINGGTTAFVNLSGAPNAQVLLAAGTGLSPGAATPLGFLNLVTAPLPLFLVDGFSSVPAITTDINGEITFAFPIPVGSYGGASLTLQAIVSIPASSGLALSNPETVLFP